MNHLSIYGNRVIKGIPAINIDLLNDDDGILYECICIPRKNRFDILKRDGENSYNSTTLGSSPIINKKYLYYANTSFDDDKLVIGQFALAIADFMFIMNDLLGIEFCSPMIDCSFRNNKNKDLISFIKASTMYMSSK